jgi:hypothetical protein
MRVSAICGFLTLALNTNAISPQCSAAMDKWCNDDPSMQSCIVQIKADNGSFPLVARFDTDSQHGPSAWRCYSPTCLDKTKSKYVSGNEYCSRPELKNVLTDCSTAVVFANGDNSTACFRIPNIIKAHNTLMVFAEARRKSCSDSGPKSIAMRRSVDNGSTWEPTRFLVDDPSTVKDGLNLGASVFDAVTGTIFLHYGVCFHDCKPSGSTFVLTSKDFGVTWLPPIDISKVVVAAGWSAINAGPGTGIQLAGEHAGRLVVAIWGKRLGHSQVEGGVASLISDDHGITWTMGAPLLPAAGYGPNECQAAQLSNGSLLMNVRDAYAGSGYHGRLFTLSNDGGTTWSSLTRVPTLTGTVCQGSMISASSSGTSSDTSTSTSTTSASTTLYYSSPLDLESRQDGYIRASTDSGATWWVLAPRLDSAGEAGFGYSSLVDMGGVAQTVATGPTDEKLQGSEHHHALGVVYEPEQGGVIFKLVEVVPPP